MVDNPQKYKIRRTKREENPQKNKKTKKYEQFNSI